MEIVGTAHGGDHLDDVANLEHLVDNVLLEGLAQGDGDPVDGVV